METLNLVILLAVSVANLTLGLLALLKNGKNLTHRLFAILTVTLVGWTTANYISITATSNDDIFWAVRAVLFFVVLQHTFFLLFVYMYPGNKLALGRVSTIAYLIFSAVTLTAGIVPGYFEGYQASGGTITVQPGPFIVLFMIHLVISVIGGIRRLVLRLNHTRGLRKNQYKFLLLAASFLLILSPFTNFVLPALLDIQWFVPFSPLYTLVFASLIAYAMIRHGLLEFRLLVARAFVYILTLSFVGAVFAVATFALSIVLLDTSRLDRDTMSVYVFLALVLALSFQLVKRFFDRLSSRIFFKDTYDPQRFLNDFNRLLVGHVELEALLYKIINVIESNMKSSYCTFVIRKTEFFPSRIIGNGQHQQDALHNALADARKFSSSLIITDDIDDNDNLQQKLNAENIGAIIWLFSGRERVGELVLGPKRSGDPYSQQDAQILEIIGNELVIAVQNALRFEEIQNFNLKLQEEVKKATYQLRQANERLRVLDRTKDDFISMASHQLRTPLTSVKGYLSMTLEGDGGAVTEKQRKLLNQAFISSQRMVYLIADMLNVSRLKTGKFVIEPEETDLADAVQAELDQLKGTAEARGLTLTYKKPSNFPVLYLDQTKIRQVIMNFVDNAIYYTPSGGHIDVALHDTGQAIEFTVTDDGIGVPKSERHHLFNKFYRANNAKKARPDGTGLGLYMAKKVVVAQGGSIIFHTKEDKGSTFGFTIAKAKLEPPKMPQTARSNVESTT